MILSKNTLGIKKSVGINNTKQRVFIEKYVLYQTPKGPGKENNE